MLPGKARILTCPVCGETKEVMTVLSYNTFGAKTRSDMKREMMFDINVSPVQKCPTCGEYFFEHMQKGGEGENESFELGTLTYTEAAEAVDSLLSDNLDYESKMLLYITFLHAYNDWFVRDNKDNVHIETDEDTNLFHKIIADGLLMYALEEHLNPIFVAELFREIGDFDGCLDFLKDAENIFKDQPKNLHFANEIIEHAKNKDRKVFILQ